MAIPSGPRSAAGIILVILAAGGGPGASWREIGGPPVRKPVDGPEVSDPFFALLLEIADTDSLVAWTGSEVRAAMARRGGRTLLPLADVDSLVRRRPRPEEARAWPQPPPTAVWELVLPAPIDRPMPYTILGYHPGSVRCDRRLVLPELRLPDLPLQVEREGEVVQVTATEVRVQPLVGGYLILDVDGVVDALLGGLVDDAWTLALVSARLDGERVGVATAVGRAGQRIYGEFDFRRDQVVLAGRPEVAALSRTARSLVRARRDLLPRPWPER